MELSVELGAAIAIFFLVLLAIAFGKIVVDCLRGKCGGLPGPIRRALRGF